MKRLKYMFFSNLLMILGLFVYSNAFGNNQGQSAWWIYFTDKGFSNSSDLTNALSRFESGLNDKSRERRHRAGRSSLVDEKDLPVSSEYIKQIADIGNVSIRHSSRWLNAVSINASQAETEQAARLPFVKSIRRVKSFIRQAEDIELEENPVREDLPQRDYQYDYGRSLTQNEMMNIPQIHDRGYTGEGIIIGLLDAGFDNLDHDCFQEINILAAWDFINDDDNVGNEDDHGNGSHGTKTLSIVGGFDPGQMIGMAFNATYVLGKTENTEWERPVEEDHWVAGIEWMDELGVEIVSSSLTYMDWYEYEDMDGETGVTTIAAERAIDVGMVVVASMGNTGTAEYPRNKMGAPSDGFRVFSIGAVNNDRSMANFSSRGPTWDRRIKPDFTTMGSNVRFASSRLDDSYGAGFGTSFSAPSIAGLCALLLQADPYLNPVTLRELLREVSDNNAEPDTSLGWGIPDGIAALNLAVPEPIELIIPFESGWNMVSHNLDLNIFRVEDLLAPLLEQDDDILVKDDEGRFFMQRLNFNNIPFWDGFEGYLVRVSRDFELSLEGEPIPYNHPVRLEEGWQMVSYLPDFPLSPEAAFSSLMENENLRLVKDVHGRFYFPEYDFNNIPSCNPGQGFMINVLENDELVYPRQRHQENDGFNLLAAEYFSLTSSPTLSPSISSTFGMSLLLLGENGISDGDEIGCFDQNGGLVGGGVFYDGKCGISVCLGDSSAPFPEIRYYDKSTGTVSNPAVTFVDGDSKYVPDGIAVLKVSGEERVSEAESYALDISVNPNPFNSFFNIRFSAEPISRIEFSIFDTQGREIFRETSIGRSSGIISVSTVAWAAGNYFMRVSQNGEMNRLVLSHIK